MKALIVGFGSIGKRHFEILNSMEIIDSVDIVSKQQIDHTASYADLQEISRLDIYDYFVIASETARHFEQLKYISSQVGNKKILVEKPLFDKEYEPLETTNQIFTAYNLRFHPILEKLSELLKNEDVYYANIICGQYLPTWRPNQDYRNSYSADIAQGGGVLRDLSHELDYTTWLLGDIIKLDAINSKISDLEISSDDLFTAIGITSHNVVVNIAMDYISKIPLRRIIVHTKVHTIEADLANNTMILGKADMKKETLTYNDIGRNYTYNKMHEAILEGNVEKVCSYEDGLKVVSLIDTIEYKDLQNE